MLSVRKLIDFEPEVKAERLTDLVRTAAGEIWALRRVMRIGAFIWMDWLRDGELNNHEINKINETWLRVANYCLLLMPAI